MGRIVALCMLIGWTGCNSDEGAASNTGGTTPGPGQTTAGTAPSMAMGMAGTSAMVTGGRSTVVAEPRNTGGTMADPQSAGQAMMPANPSVGGQVMAPMGGQAPTMPMDIPADGPACDPRLRARACDPGSFCYPLPDGGGYRGRCQQGDNCIVGTNEGCPAERPYCHLKGGGTFCTEVGTLKIGQDCVDDSGLPQPCEEGLVCNYSICQAPCALGADESGCPDDGRCVSLVESTGTQSGLCGARNCNWFTGELCEPDQKCNYTIRQDGKLVGSCSDLDGPGLGVDERCQNSPTGGDNCAQGLACIRPPNGVGVCRILCDTGSFEKPCPPNFTCSEQLFTRQGAVRGYGLCKVNR